MEFINSIVNSPLYSALFGGGGVLIIIITIWSICHQKKKRKNEGEDTSPRHTDAGAKATNDIDINIKVNEGTDNNSSLYEKSGYNLKFESFPHPKESEAPRKSPVHSDFQKSVEEVSDSDLDNAKRQLSSRFTTYNYQEYPFKSQDYYVKLLAEIEKKRRLHDEITYK